MCGNKLVIGILAHVDAGKTTLAEGLLYTCGQLRSLGRVDHGDAFLDNFSLERERGITIFSKQAQLAWEGLEITLLDTPGHVDFSAEMERTLQVLDYALLVISGSDGVQGHVQTLWRLLKQYKIPTFLFVNKMDQPGTDKGALLRELQSRLDVRCVEPDDQEELSMCDEALMEEYLEKGSLAEASVRKAVAERRVFPCFFGAALHLRGIEELLSGIRSYAVCPEYPEEFGARVYKISRDAAGNRLTHLKVTGGCLRVKMTVGNAASAKADGERWEEKIDQLRIYDGARFRTAEEVRAGEICAVMGLDRTFAGQGLGAERENALPVLAPVMTYRLALPEGSDPVRALGQLRALEEEEPELHVVWGETSKEIRVQIMGEVQIEVLKRLISERYGLAVDFVNGSILYKETLAAPTVGIGHFEPLRHYAEVHLLMEPAERGGGLQFASSCSEDVLDRNWQRLILTHLEEKTQLGVLTGSPVTDMRITLIGGRAHLKHTEGGDFRQATYRALRQGLMRGQCMLLEPVFSFRLEVPAENLGRAMSDIQRMSGSFDAPLTEGEYGVLTGSAPVAEMWDYQREVSAYTKGRGRLACSLKGYEACHNAEEVIEGLGYDAEADTENPASSVFCAHGAGFVVSWDEVENYAHLKDIPEERMADAGGSYGEGQLESDGANEARRGRTLSTGQRQTGSGGSDYITQEEIEDIFQRTYGKSDRDYAPYRYHQQNTGGTYSGQGGWSQSASAKAERKTADGDGGQDMGRTSAGKAAKTGASRTEATQQEEYLLIDGYNIIFAWEELRKLAEMNIDSARDRLMDICCDYQGSQGCTLILVFDAYKVKGNVGSVLKYHNIYVVYTKEAETADQYIEKTVHKIGKKHRVTVATSDGLEQMIIWGEGAVRLSAKGFREEVEAAQRQLRERYPQEKGLGAGIDLSGISI